MRITSFFLFIIMPCDLLLYLTKPSLSQVTQVVGSLGQAPRGYLPLALGPTGCYISLFVTPIYCWA